MTVRVAVAIPVSAVVSVASVLTGVVDTLARLLSPVVDTAVVVVSAPAILCVLSVRRCRGVRTVYGVAVALVVWLSVAVLIVVYGVGRSPARLRSVTGVVRDTDWGVVSTCASPCSETAVGG